MDDAQQLADPVPFAEPIQAGAAGAVAHVDDDGLAWRRMYLLDRHIHMADRLPVVQIARRQLVQIAAVLFRQASYQRRAPPPGAVKRQ